MPLVYSVRNKNIFCGWCVLTMYCHRDNTVGAVLSQWQCPLHCHCDHAPCIDNVLSRWQCPLSHTHTHTCTHTYTHHFSTTSKCVVSKGAGRHTLTLTATVLAGTLWHRTHDSTGEERKKEKHFFFFSYKCMCVFVFTYVYLYMSTWFELLSSPRKSARTMLAHIYIYTYIYTHTCVCIFICINVSICIPVYSIWTSVITHRRRDSKGAGGNHFSTRHVVVRPLAKKKSKFFFICKKEKQIWAVYTNICNFSWR